MNTIAMKRLIIMILVSVCFALKLDAQQNLAISPFFDEKSAYTKDARMVWVDSPELEPFKLTLYKSISTEKKDVVEKMEKAVRKDSKMAADKEIGYIGDNLYYAFVTLKPAALNSTLKRHIFYRNASLKPHGKKDATLVYMEGHVTMDELKKMFK